MLTRCVSHLIFDLLGQPSCKVSVTQTTNIQLFICDIALRSIDKQLQRGE